ncbi:type II secretion system F family protein [uncultured Finegoldia sp.]|uniref:type II secretion system F family protein n=1 Tax=uncultured Finegoldia sp. TaxID=328009 RepID=UPI00261B0589|nr:type II secretion system F family protein [uncultured Finegoldia sp.]
MKIENFIKDDSILKKEINFKISKKKLFLFLRQFSILLNAKIPIIEIVKLLKEQKEFKQLKPSLNKVYDNLNSGMSVTESFSNDKNFDAFFTSMLKLGEESGKLDKVIYDLSKYYERTYDINKKIQNAMIYPIILSITGIVMLIFMLKNVIPTFIDLFESSDMILPLSTRILIKVSTIINEKGAFILLLIIAAAVVSVTAYRKTKFGYFVDKFKVTNHIFGKQIQIVISSEIARSLSIAHKNSMTILDGLVIIQKSMKNKYYRQELSEIFTEIESGEFTLEESFNKRKITPQVFNSMLKVAENTGELGDIFEKLSEFYDGEVEYAIKSFISILEPMLIIFMALIVGIIVISITIPMFDVINSFN